MIVHTDNTKDCVGCGREAFIPAPEVNDGRVCVDCYAKCPHCLHIAYPHYGSLPHDSFAVREGKLVVMHIEHPIDAYPENFEPDPDVPGCGTYIHCPICGHPNKTGEKK